MARKCLKKRSQAFQRCGFWKFITDDFEVHATESVKAKLAIKIDNMATIQVPGGCISKVRRPSRYLEVVYPKHGDHPGMKVVYPKYGDHPGTWRLYIQSMATIQVPGGCISKVRRPSRYLEVVYPKHGDHPGTWRLYIQSTATIQVPGGCISKVRRPSRYLEVVYPKCSLFILFIY